MDDRERYRLGEIAKRTRKGKVLLQTIVRDVAQWNGWMPSDLHLQPNLKAIEAAIDALMDLNNACTDRERSHDRQSALKKVRR